MPTVFNPLEEDEDKKDPAAEGGTPPPQIAAPSAIGSSTPAAPSAMAPAANKPSSSGQFTNLQKYINANKDFKAERGGMAGQVAGNINQAGQQVQKQVGQANQGFQAQANAEADKFRDTSATAPTAPAVAPVVPPASTPQEFTGRPATPAGAFPGLAGVMGPRNVGSQRPGAPGAQDPMDAALPAPTPVAAKPAQTGVLGAVQADPTTLTAEQKAKVVAMRDANYAGPKSFADLQGKDNLGNLQVRSQDVSTMAGQTGSETGRFNLLRQMFGKQGYNTGQQKLDNLIMQGQGDQLSKLQGTRRTAADVNYNLNTTAEAAAKTGESLTKEAVGVRDNTRGVLNTSVADKAAELKSRMEGANTKQKQDFDRMQAALKSGNISYEDAVALGIDPSAQLYDNDFSSYLSKGTGATMQNVAKKEEYDRLGALRDLIGNASTEENSAMLRSMQDPTKAGGFDPSKAVGLDKDTLSQRSAGREAEFRSTRDAIDKQMAPLVQGIQAMANGTKGYETPAAVMARGKWLLESGHSRDNLSAWDKALVQQYESLAGLKNQYDQQQASLDPKRLTIGQKKT